MSLNIQLEGTKAADIFGKGKQKELIDGMGRMVQFELGSF